MKNVLHIIDHMSLGGAQTLVKGILNSQVPEYNFQLISLRKLASKKGKGETSNVLTKYKFSLFKLKKIIKENEIDIIHCHLQKSLLVGGILKKIFFPNLILVFHEHGAINRDGLIYKKIINFFANEIDIYIAISKSIENRILKNTKIKKEKVILLYNYVDTDFFTNSNKTSTNFTLGFASRLVKRKGWFIFLESALELKNKGYNFNYFIAGNGKDKEKIIAYIENNNLSKDVIMLGQITDMPSFYNSLDVFIFSSKNEALGLTGLESNACGCPVIASNIPGIKEIMIHNENALLINPSDVSDLVKKIELLFGNEALKNKLIEGGFTKSQELNLDSFLKKLITYYENF